MKINSTHHSDKDVDIVWIDSRLKKLKLTFSQFHLELISSGTSSQHVYLKCVLKHVYLKCDYVLVSYQVNVKW